jgi:hypothetical protein
VSGGETVNCGIHGPQPFSFVCTHIAHGLLGETSPGFIYTPDPNEDYPVAWCEGCEMVFSAMSDNWITEFEKQQADYKLLCALCYQEARDLAVGGDRLRVLNG